MDHVRVSSSNLASVGYDPATQTLQIGFLNGGLDEYGGVPAAVPAGFMGAASHGSYFDAHITMAGDPYRKLR